MKKYDQEAMRRYLEQQEIEAYLDSIVNHFRDGKTARWVLDEVVSKDVDGSDAERILTLAWQRYASEVRKMIRKSYKSAFWFILSGGFICIIGTVFLTELFQFISFVVGGSLFFMGLVTLFYAILTENSFEGRNFTKPDLSEPDKDKDRSGSNTPATSETDE